MGLLLGGVDRRFYLITGRSFFDVLIVFGVQVCPILVYADVGAFAASLQNLLGGPNSGPDVTTEYLLEILIVGKAEIDYRRQRFIVLVAQRKLGKWESLTKIEVIADEFLLRVYRDEGMGNAVVLGYFVLHPQPVRQFLP
jgi:hypothetical protein